MNYTPTDITSVIKEKLQIYKELITKLQRLNYELFELNKRLIQAESQKTHVSYFITQEILEPLDKIIFLAKSELNKGNDNEFVKQIMDFAFQLEIKIRNLAFSFELESGVFEPDIKKDIDIRQVVENTLELFYRRCQQKAISVSVKENNIQQTKAEVDADVLSLCLMNILDVAIYNSVEDTNILIEINYFKDNFQINIKNCELSSQNETKDSNTSLKLGLAVTYGLAKVLGGDLEINSYPKYTEFILKMPIKQQLIIETENGYIEV